MSFVSFLLYILLTRRFGSDPSNWSFIGISPRCRPLPPTLTTNCNRQPYSSGSGHRLCSCGRGDGFCDHCTVSYSLYVGFFLEIRFLTQTVLKGVATIHGSISVSGNQFFVFKITFFVLTMVVTVWLVAIGAILFSMRPLSANSGSAESIANGSIYMAVLCLAIIFNIAIIVPACLLLQPFRLWRVVRAERQAITPRQRFRGTFFQIRGFDRM